MTIDILRRKGDFIKGIVKLENACNSTLQVSLQLQRNKLREMEFGIVSENEGLAFIKKEQEKAYTDIIDRLQYFSEGIDLLYLYPTRG